MSTIKVTNIQHASASTAAIALNSSGQATLNGLNFPTAGPLSSRNVIVNGAMAVAQRGTSSTSTGYLVDRFEIGFGQGAVTISQESLSSGDPYDEGFRKFLRLTNSTSSTAANAYREITQKIEAQNLANSGWNYASSSSYITISFWVRASVAQTYYLKLKTNDGTAQAYASAVSLSADTWTKITKTIPGNSNITIDNDNGNGFNLGIVPFYGTDFTDSSFTTDAWAAYGSNQLPDMTNTWAGTTDATFDLTGVQLEVGSVATPFEHRSYGDELQRCERYYQMFTAGIDDRTIAMGAFYNTTFIGCALPFRTTMRSSPTIDASSSSGHFSFYIHGSQHQTNSVTAGGGTTPYAAGIRPSSSVSGTQGSAGEFKASNAAASLAFSAEL